MRQCDHCFGDGVVGADGGGAYVDPARNVACRECDGTGEVPGDDDGEDDDGAE